MRIFKAVKNRLLSCCQSIASFFSIKQENLMNQTQDIDCVKPQEQDLINQEAQEIADFFDMLKMRIEKGEDKSILVKKYYNEGKIQTLFDIYLIASKSLYNIEQVNIQDNFLLLISNLVHPEKLSF
jgi:hypothetical protein